MPRPKSTGSIFYLGRVRWFEGRHSLELRAFLASFEAAGQMEKLAMLQNLLAGSGFDPAQLPSPDSEDQDTTTLLDNLLM